MVLRLVFSEDCNIEAHHGFAVWWTLLQRNVVSMRISGLFTYMVLDGILSLTQGSWDSKSLGWHLAGVQNGAGQLGVRLQQGPRQIQAVLLRLQQRLEEQRLQASLQVSGYNSPSTLFHSGSFIAP